MFRIGIVIFCFRELKEGIKEMAVNKTPEAEMIPPRKPVQLKFLIPEDAVMVNIFVLLHITYYISYANSMLHITNVLFNKAS